MPMIDITLPSDALDDAATDALVERLTTTVSECEGMADNPRVRSTIWTFVQARPSASIYAGGRTIDEPRYRIQITVAAGTIGDVAKARLIAEATKHVLDAEGASGEPADAARVWCHIHELPDGNWGAVGKVWRLHEIAEFAGIHKEQLTDPAAA